MPEPEPQPVETPASTPARQSVLLMRLQPVHLYQQRAIVPEDARSLMILNTLQAAIYIRFGYAFPVPGDYDWVVNIGAIVVLPTFGKVVAATVFYPGAVPAGDTNLFALILSSAAGPHPTQT